MRNRETTVGDMLAANAAAKRPEKPETRSLAVIAREIRSDWTNVYFGAVPYLRALGTMDSIGDSFGCDDGRSIVLYFLSNAKSWRGDVARRVKKELKRMLAQSGRARVSTLIELVCVVVVFVAVFAIAVVAS